MADLLQKGSQWLERMRTEHCSGPIEYRRGAQTRGVRATFGSTRRESADESGLVIESRTRDFLILAAELGILPQPGDVIAVGGRRFEVMDLAGEGGWRWSDPYHQTLRIHTRHTGDEP